MDLRKRPSSRYHLAPVRLYHQNAIPKPPQSTGNESHANLPRSPDRIIWPHVWHWTGWHLCWHLNTRWETRHSSFIQFIFNLCKNVHWMWWTTSLGLNTWHLLWQAFIYGMCFAVSHYGMHVHRTYPQPLKHNQYLYIQCTKIQWLPRRDVNIASFHFSVLPWIRSWTIPKRLPESDLLISAAGLDTGISDGESTSAEESGAIAEECWPVP